MKSLIVLLVFAIAIPAAADSPAGDKDWGLYNWHYSMAYTGFETEWGSLLVAPDGSGKPFAEVFVVNGQGSIQDGTITLEALDDMGLPMVGIPAADIWIAPVDEEVMVCGGGHFIADAPTDSEGVTRFSETLAGGGHSENGLAVYYQGDMVSDAGMTALHLRINSPDINGDGVVNLTDTGFFASDMFVGPYSYRSDYNADGSINLTDAGFIGTRIGAHCAD